MKTLNIYEEGEEVLVRAKVSKISIEKDKVSYQLMDATGNLYPHKFTDKELIPAPVNPRGHEDKSLPIEETE